MISKKTISEIYDKSIIEDVVSDFLNLKKSGSNYKCLSPFVDEKTPSFVVSPSKQIFKCFSSGKSGNVITFLMEQEGMTYKEALLYLANKYNIAVEHDKYTDEDKEKKDKSDSLFIINEFAKKYYHDKLINSNEGIKVALSYLQQRGFGDEIIKNFELGYSLNCRDCFFKEAIDKGYKVEYLEELGIVKSKDGNSWDNFRDRVIFPIHNIWGSVVGFGARSLKNTSKAKYLNSSESDIYNKSKILYGIYQAKDYIRKKDMCFIVEGYTDLLRLHQLGLKNSVSTSGTALTIDQIKFIKQRFTDNITIIYDGDSSGVNASFRAIELIMSQNMNVNMVYMSSDEDPDSLFSKFDQNQMMDYIDKNTHNFIDFKMLYDDKSDDILDKSKTVTYLSKLLSHIENPAKKELYLEYIAKKFNITKQSVEQLSRLKTKKIIHKNKISSDAKSQPQNIYEYKNSEKDLIRLLIKNGSDSIFIEDKQSGKNMEFTVGDIVINEFKRNNIAFDDELLNDVYEHIKELVESGKNYSHLELVKHPNYEISRLISSIISDDITSKYELSKKWEVKSIKLNKELSDCLRRFKSNFIKERINRRNKQLHDKHISSENRINIMREIKQLTSKKRKIDRELSIIVDIL